MNGFRHLPAWAVATPVRFVFVLGGLGFGGIWAIGMGAFLAVVCQVDPFRLVSLAYVGGCVWGGIMWLALRWQLRSAVVYSMVGGLGRRLEKTTS